MTKGQRYCRDMGLSLSTVHWRSMTMTDRAHLRKIFSHPQATKDIAERFGITTRTVRKWMGLLGYKHGKGLTPEAAAVARRKPDKSGVRYILSAA